MMFKQVLFDDFESMLLQKITKFGKEVYEMMNGLGLEPEPTLCFLYQDLKAFIG